MTFKEIIRNNRSYRRYFQVEKIGIETLRELVGYARLSASSGNIQALKFFLSADDKSNHSIFKYLKWAFYYRDWDGPEEGERPSAYVIILGDTEIHQTVEIDVGIAAQSILLAAVEKGFGGCMFGSIDRVGLRKELKIPRKFQIPLIIALGKPREKVVIEDVKGEDGIEYWRDLENIHHVPKRLLDDLIVDFK